MGVGEGVRVGKGVETGEITWKNTNIEAKNDKIVFISVSYQTSK